MAPHDDEVLIVGIRGFVTEVVAAEGDDAVHRVHGVEDEDLVVDDGLADSQDLRQLEVADLADEFAIRKRGRE